MRSHRYPGSLQFVALLLFCMTGILPILLMLARCGIGLSRDDSHLAAILLDSRQLLLLGRSLKLAVLTALVAFVLGFPVSCILSAQNLPWRRICLFLVLTPLLIPPYIMAGAWIHLLSPSGLINRSLNMIFGPSVRVTVFSETGCIWCLGVSFFPIVAMIVAAGLSRMDRGILDVTRLYSNRWGVFWHGVVPQIFPHIMASICLVLVFALGRYGVPSLLGINTYPVEIFAQFSAFYDENSAVIMSIPLITLVIVLILLQRRIMRDRAYVCLDSRNERYGLIFHRKWLICGIVYIFLLSILTTVTPFASVLLSVEESSRVITTISSASGSIVTTSMLALLSVLISLAIALPISSYLSFSHNRIARLVDMFSWMPIAVPGTIIGLGLIQLSNASAGFRNADSFGWLLLCAYVGMFCPFAIRILKISFDRCDLNLYDRATMDCQRWYQRLFFVDVKLHSSAIIASSIIVCVLVLGELNATVLLIPPGRETLAVTVDNLLHYGANVNASILCLLEAGLAIMFLAIGFSIRSIRWGREG